MIRRLLTPSLCCGVANPTPAGNNKCVHSNFIHSRKISSQRRKETNMINERFRLENQTSQKSSRRQTFQGCRLLLFFFFSFFFFNHLARELSFRKGGRKHVVDFTIPGKRGFSFFFKKKRRGKNCKIKARSREEKKKESKSVLFLLRETGLKANTGIISMVTNVQLNSLAQSGILTGRQ